MELFIYLVVMLVVVAVNAVTRARRRGQVNRDLDGWARHLGMVRVGNELFGQIDDVPVGARLAFDSPHGAKTAANWTLYARLQPPLDLGLVVHNRRYPVQVSEGGMGPVTPEDPEFNNRFLARADEPQRAMEMLGRPLRRELGSALHPAANFLLTDAGVAVQTFQSTTGEEMIRTGLQTVARLTRLINRQRDGVRVAGLLAAHRHAWARFAGDNGLSGISAPLCMFGTIEGATVYAYSVRTGAHSYCLEVWMRFEEPLALGLLVQPMRTLDRVKDMFGSDDHELGDPLFDETFVVRVSDPVGTAALLDEETRKRILVIHDTVGPLSLTDDGLSVRLPAVPPDPAVVPKVVRAMLDIATHIADKRRKQRLAGPYR